MQWNLIRLRKEAGLTQPAMAKILGISIDAYGYKERGQRPFDLDEMFIVRDLFCLRLEDIFLPSNSIVNRMTDFESIDSEEEPITSLIDS